MARISKKATEAKNIIGDKSYDITAAIAVLKKASFENFDPTLSISLDMNLDVRKADQQLRGSIVLPAGTGKTIKVLAIADGADAEAAKSAGADIVDDIRIMDKVKGENWFDFDVIVTTPSQMPQLAKFGQLLGPKGLMPNPKIGTVSTDLEAAIKNLKKGSVTYRTDDTAQLNVMFGKKSFSDTDLISNYETIMAEIKAKRPAAVKGDYIKSITISTTMSPAVKLNK